jgi:tetratricopeptide (TPR) repeat protein
MTHSLSSASGRRRTASAVGLRTALVLALAAVLVGCSGDPAVRKQEHLDKGNQFAAEEKYREAVVEYRNALQIDPTFGAAHHKAAEAYAKLGDAPRALAEYVRAADLLPNDLELQVTTGALLMASGRAEAARARADAVLAKDPKHAAAHVLRGNALGGLNELDQALSSMEEAIRLDPGRGSTYAQMGAVQMAKGDQAKAEESFRKAVEISPDWVAGHLALAQYLWAIGQPDAAEREFQTALKIDQNHGAANRAMAVFYLATKRADRAEEFLKRIADTSKLPAAVMTLADYYLDMQRPKDAQAILLKLTDTVSPPVGSRERLARAYAVDNQRQKAYELLDDILSQDKTNARAHLLRSQLLHQERKIDDALASVRQAIAADSTITEAHFTLGKIYASRGDAAGAEAAYREVIRLNPMAAAAQVELSTLQLSRSPREALASSEAAVKAQPNSLEVRLALVRSLLASRELARAEKELAPLLRERPQDASVQVQAGVLASAKGQGPAARAAFERAMSLEPTSIEPLAGIIALELNAKDFASVRNRLSARLGGNPGPDLLLLAARTYGAMQDFAEAEKVLRRAIEASPSLLPAYSMLGQVYLRQGKLDEARKEFDSLSGRQTNPVGSLTMAGVISQAQGNVDVARQRFERAVSLDPRAGVAANNLAWIYADSGQNLPQAVRLAETAAEVMPETPEVLDTLGWAYFKSRLPALAVPAFVRTVERAPRNPVYHYHLGLAYEQGGDRDSARRSLMRALELSPDFQGAADAKQALARLAEQQARQRTN